MRILYLPLLLSACALTEKQDDLLRNIRPGETTLDEFEALAKERGFTVVSVSTSQHETFGSGTYRLIPGPHRKVLYHFDTDGSGPLVLRWWTSG